jgi:cytochrome c oxidase cbb3-type subunit 2
MTRPRQGLILILLGFTTALSPGQNAGESSGYRTPRDGFTAEQQRGHGLYLRYCVGCHGVHGDGAGASAPYLDPKPRDFTQATFKCRSTPTGTLPLDSDLFNTITRGIHASGMPSWNPLAAEQRDDLIAYIKTFSPRFKEEKPGTPIVIPAEPPTSAESVKRGAELFQSMNCWSCHGKEGRGNGPSAVSLTDSRGFPVTPYDLTSGRRFKCGETDPELFQVLMNGLDGTPMPSFADALKPDQIWDLVHYIQTLRPSRKRLAMSAPWGKQP